MTVNGFKDIIEYLKQKYTDVHYFFTKKLKIKKIYF